MCIKLSFLMHLVLEILQRISAKITKAFCWAKVQTPGGRTCLAVDMLAVESLRGSNGEEGAPGSFPSGGDETFGDEVFFEDIHFGDFFMGIDVDGDVLPELELDPAEIFAEFPVGSTEAEESSASATIDAAAEGPVIEAVAVEGNKEATRGAEVVSAVGKVEEAATPAVAQEGEKNRKPSPPPKSSQSQGKRKAKVDWTPELHRKFVQAVEQLGIDKAVPSRILELMGIDCLTRHNIASHLQKYRSHRKHLLAREAEAASWSQRRQIGGGGGGVNMTDISPWLAPTIGFPPRHPPPPTQLQPFRPLHVWGHPTVGEAPPMTPPPHVWLRHLTPPSPTPAQPWAAAHPPADPSYWHHHYPRGMVPEGVTQGTPWFPQPFPTPRFASAAVPGMVPHHPIYRTIHPPLALDKLTNSELQLHWGDSMDAAIEEVLAKPWLPLPLGLKPPAADSVLVELQKHGLSTLPPSPA